MQSIIYINQNHHPYANIISGCRRLMQILGAPVLRHTSWEQNKVADLLATEGARGEILDTPQILLVPPMYVNKDIEAGILGTTFPKKVVACNFTDSSHVNLYPDMGPGAQIIIS
ncbi:hypothetical protein FXO38_14462, partial [Capsicum annuum]